MIAAERLFTQLSETTSPDPKGAIVRLIPKELCSGIKQRLQEELHDELPLSLSAGRVFRPGIDKDMDELRKLAESSKDYVLELEAQERQTTGISNLKIRYTRAFGYYIEVSKARLSQVPTHYHRKQTLTNAERFVTEELNALQGKILSAEQQLLAIQSKRFEALREEIAKDSLKVRQLAVALARLDVSLAWAHNAACFDYTKPIVDESCVLELKESRHPVVEQLAERGSFVPNTIKLDARSKRLMIITGPNMAGKSTVMRQCALIVIMAQSGGFVPAEQARIGMVDRIYTRIGASDNLAAGQSTFMVEMQETAAMLRGATQRSLVLLDEVGRGTSSLDGMAIAWAVAEHFADTVKCRCLFATHYHGLCALADRREHVFNCNVTAKEQQGEVVFFHRLSEGVASKSYGVAVAKLAGLPPELLDRAAVLLQELPEEPRFHQDDSAIPTQRELFETQSDAKMSDCEETILAMDLNTLRPIDALLRLQELQDNLKGT
ncbi:MAG: DNA mismatch repair protein MutS [Myxococcales bacterium]|nr:MAG: DNA mismatch repair protein MutS [Myxococcales bacterium]